MKLINFVLAPYKMALYYSKAEMKRESKQAQSPIMA